MTDNPIMIIVMDGVLDVLHHFVRTIGDYQNAFVLPSRRRFMKHMEEGNVEAAVAELESSLKNVEAAVAEMESSLKRLQRAYLSKVDVSETSVPLADVPAPGRKRVAASPIAKTTRRSKARA
jgi:hypothetical protein